MRTELLLGCLAVCLVACGDDDDGGTPDAAAAPDVAVVFDADTTDAFETASTCTSTGGAGGTNKLFLQFEGQVVTMGPTEDATMNISTVGGGTLAAYQPVAADRATKIQKIVDGVAEVLGPYDIEVVTTRPAAGPYKMIIIGGQSTDIGLQANVGAVSSFGCSGVPNAIGFGFDLAFTSDDMVSLIVAMTGLSAGIPSSNESGECMCWNGPNCGALSAPCTLGGAGTPLATPPPCGPETEMDTKLRFEMAYGCRP